MIGALEKDFYFGEDGLGDRQRHYWDTLTESGRLN